MKLLTFIIALESLILLVVIFMLAIKGHKNRLDVNHANQLEIMEMLNQGELDAVDETGRTLLMLCAQYGYIELGQRYFELAKQDVDRKVDFDAFSGEGYQVIHYLSDQSAHGNQYTPKIQKTFLDELMKTGVDIEVLDHKYGITPLYLAAYTGNQEMISELAARGANINWADANGVTATMVAVLMKFPDAARVLLNLGARIEIRDYNGWDLMKHVEEQLENAKLPVISLRESVHQDELVHHEYTELKRQIQCIIDEKKYHYKNYNRQDYYPDLKSTD